jgi:hypothetical protein
MALRRRGVLRPSFETPNRRGSAPFRNPAAHCVCLAPGQGPDDLQPGLAGHADEIECAACQCREVAGLQ